MSALPIITASLAPGFPDGITLYQSLAQSVNLNELIRVKLLGEQLPKYAEPFFDGTDNIYTNRIRFTATGLPAGLTAASPYSAVKSVLSGTPTTVASTSALFKIEVFKYTDFAIGTDVESDIQLGFVTVPINVVAAPSTVTPETPLPVILPTAATFVRGTYFSFTLSAATATHPLYWSATGLPAGLNIESGYIQGIASETGTFPVVLSLRYMPDSDAGYVIETKTISLVVAPAAELTSGGNSYITDGGIDLFLDLQSMALSLDLPKAEAVIPADSTIVNTTTKQLVVKPSQVLNLNVRFTKGATVVDPDPASLRFGIGSKIGGPLLMTGSTFTKVGAGSSAYFKMRITSDSSEFEALEKDYYDADAVEQVTQTADTQAGGTEPLEGLCEIEFTTGSGGTLATFRSDNLAVLIRRSLLAGI